MTVQLELAIFIIRHPYENTFDHQFWDAAFNSFP